MTLIKLIKMKPVIAEEVRIELNNLDLNDNTELANIAIAADNDSDMPLIEWEVFDKPYVHCGSRRLTIEDIKTLIGKEIELPADEELVLTAQSEIDRLRAENERLRALVVTMCTHGDVPVFEQGYKEHECLEPVTAAFCNHLVSTIEKLQPAEQQEG